MESKFAHLLQPIRDLAGNWDVNVAEELEEYLEELESIHFDLEEDSSPSLNFAEAALVIQGSTSVYSKKVEYLHSLVYAALEAIAEKRAQRVTREDDDGNDGSDLEAEEQFLTLDDIAEGGGEIDIQEDSTREAPATIRAPTSLLILGQCKGPMSLSRGQTYMDASGAVLIDPADSMDSSATYHRITEADDGPMHDDETLQPPPEDAVDSTPLPAQYEDTYNDDDGWNCEDNAASVTSEESEDADPYRPLQWDQPGNLTVQPFKYRKPIKRAVTKKEAGFNYGPLISLVAFDTVGLDEFKDYLKESAVRQAKAGHAQQHESDSQEDLDDYMGDGGEGGFSDNDHDPGEMASFSPIAQGASMFDCANNDDYFATQQQGTQISCDLTGSRYGELQLVVDTHLEERVAQWQQKIQPFLDDQNQAPSFDITLYGKQILSTMAAKVPVNQWTTFGSVAADKKQFEVTRMFASMLQLVNAGTLKIMKT